MATTPSNPAQFISSLLTAVRDITGRRPPPAWTHVDEVQRKRDAENRDAVDAAIRVAVGKGWLCADGDPPSSVTLTLDGLKLLEPGPAGVKPT